MNNFHTAFISMECRHQRTFCSFFQIQKSVLPIDCIWFGTKSNCASTGDVFVALQWPCKFIWNNFHTALINVQCGHESTFCFFSILRNRFSLYFAYGLIEN